MRGNRRDTEAARNFAERRRREDEAPRLRLEVPDLVSLDLELTESKGAATAGMSYVRRIVVALAPAHFEIPCGDSSCSGGGHDLTYGVLRALRSHATSFDGDDDCRGSVATTNCGRVLRYRAKATYGSA